jgi:hypothetical protein
VAAFRTVQAVDENGDPLVKPGPGMVGITSADGADAPATDDEAPADIPEPPMPSAPPFKLGQNEIPTSVEKVSIKLSIVPRGDKSLAFSLNGTFDEPGAVPGVTFQVPTHWKYEASVPRLSLTYDSKLNAETPGKLSFKGKGTMTVEADTGTDQFAYDFAFDEAGKSASANLTNLAAKVKLALKAKQSDLAREPQVTTQIVSTEDNAVLGTVALDPKRPRFAVITLKDGTTQDWELYPEGLLPSPQGPAIGVAPTGGAPRPRASVAPKLPAKAATGTPASDSAG